VGDGSHSLREKEIEWSDDIAQPVSHHKTCMAKVPHRARRAGEKKKNTLLHAGASSTRRPTYHTAGTR